MPLELKIQLEKEKEEGEKVLNPETYDEVDALIGALALIVREICIFYGIHSVENKKASKSSLSRVRQFNQEKAEFYSGKLETLLEVAKKYNIAV